MSRFDREPVPVPIGPCECPGTPHGDGDFVYLAPVISMAGGMAVQGAILDAQGDSVRLQELLAHVYLAHGVTGWNLLDERGKPVPCTPDRLAVAIPYGTGGQAIAEKANDLYADDVMRPLVERLNSLLPTGPTASSPSLAETSTTTPSEPSSPENSAASAPSTS